MSKGKINPRRRPATLADVERAKREAADDAMTRILQMVLFVLLDKHGATHEELGRLSEEINYLADSIVSGYVSWRDIEKALGEEYDVHIAERR